MTDQPNPVPGPPPMRASDRDREQVATLLQTAMSEGRLTVTELEARLDTVYAAKTLADLETVTKDLPGHALSLSKHAAVIGSTATRAGQLSMSDRGPSKGNLVAVMSGVVRKGVWEAPTRLDVVAIMGGVELDFTGARLSGMETVMTVTAIMGGVEITVPEGLTVRVDGVGIMGAFEDSARQLYGPESPVLRVKGVAIMSGVEVRRPKKSISS